MRESLLTVVAFGIGMAFAASMALADINIATVGPMTAQYANHGEQLRHGAEMAVREINEAGGVLGEKLALTIGDDACDPKQAWKVARDLAAKQVVFVAGHYCSGASIPASEVYAEENIVQISPASTHPDFTDKRPGKGIFRLVARDDAQGIVAGNLLARKFAGKNIAILNDQSPYGKGLAVEARKALNASGGKEVLNESYKAGEQDYTALVSKLKEAKVEVVYLGGYHTEGGLILRQMREQGMSALMVSGDAFIAEGFWRIAGPAGEGTIMTLPPDVRTNPSAADIVKKFNDEGYDPVGYTLHTYTAIKIWADAVKTAGSFEFDKVVEALMKTDTDSVVGKIRFDDKGDLKDSSYVWYKWSNGNYAEDKSM